MDWYDGEPRVTITEAMNKAPKMPAKPKEPTWENNRYVYASSDLGEIYELRGLPDRIMHTHTMSGHCFVWNYVNQPIEDGFRLFSYRSKDGWARVSIQTRTMETLIDGSGSRMYAGNWRELANRHGVRVLNGENLVLLDFKKMFSYGGDIEQSVIDAMENDVEKWWGGLDKVAIPKPTDIELARNIVRR